MKHRAPTTKWEKMRFNIQRGLKEGSPKKTTNNYIWLDDLPMPVLLRTSGKGCIHHEAKKKIPQVNNSKITFYMIYLMQLNNQLNSSTKTNL